MNGRIVDISVNVGMSAQIVHVKHEVLGKVLRFAPHQRQATPNLREQPRQLHHVLPPFGRSGACIAMLASIRRVGDGPLTE